MRALSVVSPLVQSRVSPFCTKLSSTPHPNSRAEAGTAGAPAAERPFVLHRLTRILLRAPTIRRSRQARHFFSFREKSFQKPIRYHHQVGNRNETIGRMGAGGAEVELFTSSESSLVSNHPNIDRNPTCIGWYRAKYGQVGCLHPVSLF